MSSMLLDVEIKTRGFRCSIASAGAVERIVSQPASTCTWRRGLEIENVCVCGIDVPTYVKKSNQR